jgi:hypothetical protein
MNLNLWLGIAAVAYGLYTLYLRSRSPDKFGKLEAMKQQWGDRAGTIAHVIGYTVLPIIFGLGLIASSLLSRGGSAR